MHTMQAICRTDSEFKPIITSANRAMWAEKKELAVVLPPKDKRDSSPAKLTPAQQLRRNQALVEGFYIFGGQGEDGEILNDLWLIEPDYAKNSEQLKDEEYT